MDSALSRAKLAGKGVLAGPDPHTPAAADPDGRLAGIYRDIARRAAERLSRQKKDYSAAFPSIVVDNG